MKIKTSELIGAALDWAVAKCEGEDYSPVMTYSGIGHEFPATTYSNNWELAGPIIERERIEIVHGNPLYFPNGNEAGDFYESLWISGRMHGQTPLIAAMRCYVASKLGETVDVPEDLV